MVNATERMELLRVFSSAIIAERKRAHLKHGKTSMEQADTIGDRAFRRATILMEEAAECGTALNDHENGDITLRDPQEVGARFGLPVGGIAQVGHQVDELDKELIQTAAMAYTWWANRRGDRLRAPGTESDEVTIGKESAFPEARIDNRAVFVLRDRAGNEVGRQQTDFVMAPGATVVVPESIPIKIAGRQVAAWTRVGESWLEGHLIIIPVESTPDFTMWPETEEFTREAERAVSEMVQGVPTIRWPDGTSTSYDTVEDAMADFVKQAPGNAVFVMDESVEMPADDPDAGRRGD